MISVLRSLCFAGVQRFPRLSARIVGILPLPWQEVLRRRYQEAVVLPKLREIEGVRLPGREEWLAKASGAQAIADQKLPCGVNILSFPRGAFGLAHQARSIGASLAGQGVQIGFIDCAGLLPFERDEDESVCHLIREACDFRCNLFSFNADQVPAYFARCGIKPFLRRFNIHYIAWELERYPKALVPAMNLMHEVWTMSTFVERALSDRATVPVRCLPYAIDFAIPDPLPRAHFHLPEGDFLFLFAYDISSLSSRKNPQAVIEAFRRAFPRDVDVGLVIKVARIAGHGPHDAEFRQLREAIGADRRIHLIDALFPDAVMKRLVLACDAFVSLHRAEGFGMGLAEAMKMGKPVIATNYSGNADFTTPETACLVDYRLVPIRRGEYVFFEEEQVWAEPDLDHAATLMRNLAEDRRFYEEVASHGKQFIDVHYNHDVVGKRYIERLTSLGFVP